MNLRLVLAGVLVAVVAVVVWHYRWPIVNSIRPRHLPTPLVAGQYLPRITALPVGVSQAQPIGPAPGHFLLINVFATWCGPCRSETPALKRLSDDTAGSLLQIVGIDQHENDDAVLRFSEAYGLTYPMFVCRDEMTASILGVHFIPVTIIVDPSGVVRANVIGPMTYEQMRKLVQQIVGPRAFRA